MKSIKIEAGLIIGMGSENYEYTDRVKDELYFRSIQSGKRIIINYETFYSDLENSIIQISHDYTVSDKAITKPLQPIKTQQYITDIQGNYQKELEIRLHFIERLIQKGIKRGSRKAIQAEIPALAKEISLLKAPAASTIQHWWKLYDQSQEPNHSLINQNAFKQRPKGLDVASEMFLQNQIQINYAQLTRPSASESFRHYLRAVKEENQRRNNQGNQTIKTISERTFRNRIQELPKKEILTSRYGYEHARKLLKVSQGHLPADYPLDVVEIDHTIMNLYVVDDLLYMPLGRPWITAIKDRHTNILLGFYISFHSGGLSAIFGAIKHSLKTHRKAAELWPDLENEWPAFGLGGKYSSDRGRDFTSPKYLFALRDIGASYELCERRTPWLKGSIERFFLTLEKTFFETMPGKTFASLASRKDYDPLEHSVIRFSSLIYLLHKWAMDSHNVMPHSRKQVSPLDLWNEGVAFAPPAIPASTASLDIILGQRESRKVLNEGIQFHGLHYADMGLQKLVDEVGKGVKVDFIVSPENLGYIHVKHPLTGEYQKVFCSRPDYANGLTLFQHQYLRNEAKLYASGKYSVDQLFSTRKTIEARIQEDIDAKNNFQKKQLARVAAINSNAVLQNQIRSVDKPFSSTQDDNDAASAEWDSDKSEPFTNIPVYAWS